MVFDPASRYFTTIGNYKQSGNDVTYNGQIYRWSKHHEWEKFIDLPSRISQPFQLAMNVTDPADRTLLEKHGWGLQSAVEMSLDIFRAYRKLDDFLLLAEQILDVGIQFGDLSGKESNVGQQLFDDHLMMAAQVSTQGFFQFGDFGTKAPLG
jgi:hypothetical protein